MPAKRIIKSSLSALIASCLAFASGPSFGQENETPEPVKITKRTNSAGAKGNPPKKATVATQGERVSIAKTTKPTGTRLKKGADNAVVTASSLDDKAPLQMPENESVILSEEPSPMVSQEEWSYPSANESVGAGYPGSGVPGTQVYIDTGILGGILSRTKVRIEGATFWGSGYDLDPIVTSGDPTVLPPGNVGAIGPGTPNLFGGSEVLANTSQGLRFATDLSFDRSGTRGLLFRMFYASEIGESYTNAGGPNIVVARPFSSVPGSAPSTILVNHPNATVAVAGTIDASVTSKVSGGDLLVRTTVGRDRYGAFDLLVGYQNMRLDEGLSVVSNTTRRDTNNNNNNNILDLEDRFSSSNRFHGFALGFDSTVRRNQWSLGTMFKLGMGNVEREIDIDGFRRVTVTNQAGTVLSTATTPEGLLARTTNNGSYRSDRFILSPEVALTLGYRFSPRMDATFTYTYLGLPSVARAGEQLDPNLEVNVSSPLAGPVAPRFLETTSNYSLHSLSYGIQWRF